MYLVVGKNKFFVGKRCHPTEGDHPVAIDTCHRQAGQQDEQCGHNKCCDGERKVGGGCLHSSFGLDRWVGTEKREEDEECTKLLSR